MFLVLDLILQMHWQEIHAAPLLRDSNVGILYVFMHWQAVSLTWAFLGDLSTNPELQWAGSITKPNTRFLILPGKEEVK